MTGARRPLARVLPSLALMLACGCGTSRAGEGESCTRSSQCVSGLVCVEGNCSGDLGPLDDPSRVPMLTPPPPEPAAEEDAGGAEAAP